MSDLVVQKRSEEIVVVELNRPEAYNAFNLEMITDLTERLIALATDDSVRGIVMTGRGKSFCAGGDLKWALQYSDNPKASFHALAARLHLSVMEIRKMRKPVIAAINGIAAGAGFSLALACDFRVMDRSAKMKQAYTSNGLSIDGGGTFTLPRIVGLARALEIAAFDQAISAERALELGLVTEVVDDGTALDNATAMAQRLTKISMHAFGWSKKLFNNSYSSTLETHLEQERSGLSNCAAHADGREGLAAFSEKRKPVFGK